MLLYRQKIVVCKQNTYNDGTVYCLLTGPASDTTGSSCRHDKNT